MEDYQEQLVRIADKLARYLVEDSKIDLTGSMDSSHNYHSYPVPEEMLAAFEQACGVTLPADYRQFLLTIGTGAGPNYGLLPLNLERGYRFCNSRTELVQPFPGYPNAPEAEWLDMLWAQDEDPTASSAYAGLLEVAGKDLYHLTGLVVSGAHRGRVLRADLALDSVPVFYPEANFLDWYEDWLDSQLPGYRATARHRYLTTPDVHWQRHYLAYLGADDLDLLRPASRHPHWGIRYDAIGKLMLLDYAWLRPVLHELWATEPDDVYRVIWHSGHAEEWLPEIAHTLAHPDPSPHPRDPAIESPGLRALSLAGYLLLECSADHSAWVQPLLQHPHPRVRESAAYMLEELREKFGPLAAGS